MKATVRYRRVGGLVWRTLREVTAMDFTWSDVDRPRGFDAKKERPSSVQHYFTQFPTRVFQFWDGSWAEIPSEGVEFRISVAADGPKG